MRAKGMRAGRRARARRAAARRLRSRQPALAQPVTAAARRPRRRAGPKSIPSAPLDAMPDLGVEWPDLAKPEPRPMPPQTTRAAARRGVERSGGRAGRRAGAGRRRRRGAALSRDAGRDRRDRGGEAIRAEFDKQSALVERAQGKPPTPRRSTAAPAPMPNCSPNCCAPRAIIDAEVEPDIRVSAADGRGRDHPARVAGHALPLRGGRAARARRGGERGGGAARGVRGQGRASRSSPSRSSPPGPRCRSRLASRASPPRASASRTIVLDRRARGWRGSACR